MEESSIIDHKEVLQEDAQERVNDFEEDALTLEEEKALYGEFSEDSAEQRQKDETDEHLDNNPEPENVAEEKIQSDPPEIAGFNTEELIKFCQSDISDDERSNIRNHLLQDQHYAHAFNMASDDNYALSFIAKNDPRAHHIMSFGTDEQKQELAQQIMSIKQSYADQAMDLENQNIQRIRENYVATKLNEARNTYWQQGISANPQTADAMASLQNSIFEKIIANYPNSNSPQHQQIFNTALSEACVDLCEKLQISPAELANALAETFAMGKNKDPDVKGGKNYEIDKEFVQKAQNIHEAQTRAQSLTRTNGSAIEGSSLESFINMSDEELVNLSRNHPAKYAQFEKLLMNQG